VGLIREVVLLPFAPVRGVGWVMQIVIDEAEREQAASASPARALEELTAAVATGEITPAEAEALEAELVERMIAAAAAEGE
jgi:gas vesicle protein GvpG